jgi:hypothetical protein
MPKSAPERAFQDARDGKKRAFFFEFAEESQIFLSAGVKKLMPHTHTHTKMQQTAFLSLQRSRSAKKGLP